MDDPHGGAEADPGREPTIQPLTSIRRRIGTHMIASQAVSPHVSMAIEVDFAAVDALRSARGAEWREREGFSLTYLPFIASALCRAIRAFPLINSEIVDGSQRVFPYVHLGVAVDLDFKGLVVPVIRDADQLSVPQLARQASAAAAAARARKLGPDDFAGGTYTITNPGRTTYFTTPIINQPQVAILSTDGVRKRPVVLDDTDEIVVRPMGLLTQSFDHRAFDGAYSSAFLASLKHEIESYDWAAELP